MHELLTIGQVADEAGLATSALRYYDELGLVEPATRISGQRRYEPQVLRRLRIVELCQRAGFTLGEIEQLLDGQGDWRPLAEDKLVELDRRIRELRYARRLVQAALECDCADLEGCDQTAHDADRICGTRPETDDDEETRRRHERRDRVLRALRTPRPGDRHPARAARDLRP